MSKRRSSAHATRLLDPEGVLSGRVTPSLDGLLELIHRVNPTGRDRDPREEQARYTQKARLQSLLVRRFAEDLAVEPDPRNEGVVSLGRRGLVREGCHAVVSTLDDDARSWITFQLDLERAAPGAERTGAPGRAAAAVRPRTSEALAFTAAEPAALSIDDLLHRAEAAIVAYDYDQARADLEEALASSGGATAPAGALLSLLVDTLGADADALALEGSLSAAALGDRGVRGALALAAARTGEEAIALTHVRGADPTRSAEVFTALAAAALRDGDTGRAAEHLAEARRSDPTSPGLAAVAEELGRARAAARAPAEAELARVFEAGLDSEASRQAQAVLARWPDSAPARRILREIEGRRRHEEARKKAAEAEDALTRGDAAIALTLFRHALAALPAGPEAEAIEARCAAVEAALHRQRAEASVAEACRKLDGPDRAAALLVYLQMDAELRAHVRELRPMDELRWLEASAANRDRARVDAVLALVQAREVLEAAPDRALDLLAQHRAALETVHDAKRTAQEATARSRDVRTARARGEVAAARAAFDAGDMHRVVERLGDPVVRDLPGDEQEAAIALRARAAASAARQHRLDAVARMRAAGRPLEARDAVLSLLASEPRDEQARWQAEHDALTVEIQRTFEVELDETPCAVGALSVPSFYPDMDPVHQWLTRDGRTLVLGEAHDHRVFVRLFDVEGACVRATVALRTPDRMGRLTTVVDGDELWLLGDSGAVLRIGMKDWHVRSFHGAAELGLDNSVIEQAALGTPAGNQRHLWLLSGEAHRGEKLRIVDMERRRVVRESADAWSIVPLTGLDEPRMACVHRTSIVLYNGRGAALPGGQISSTENVPDVAAHPSGSGIVLLTMREKWEATGPLCWQEISFTSGGALDVPRASTEIEGSYGESPHMIASARDSGIVAVTFHSERGGELLALFSSGGALSPIYRVPAPPDVVLVQDAQGRRVCAVCSHMEGIDVVELGAAAPVLPPRPERPVFPFPTPYDLVVCSRPAGERGDRILALSRSLNEMDGSQVGRWVRERRQRFADRPIDLLDTFHALDLGAPYQRSELDGYLAWLFMALGDHPEARLLRAQRHAGDGRWSDALAAVSEIDASSLEKSLRKHLHHVTAVVAGYAGSSRTVRDALAHADEEDGKCDLCFVEQIALAGDDPPPDSSNRTAQLARAVLRAEEVLAAGDHAGVIALLDSVSVHWAGEVQSLARLAEAYLHTEPPDRLAHFRKLAALGRFLDAERIGSPSIRHELPLGDAFWSVARIKDLCMRVRACLDARKPAP